MKTKQAGWGFVGWWVLAILAGRVIYYFLYGQIFESSIVTLLIYILVTVVPQWIVLRCYLRKASQWALLKTIGLGIWGLIIVIYPSIQNMHTSQITTFMPPIFYWSPFVILLGIIIFLFEWYALQNEVYRAYWWIIGNIGTRMISLLFFLAAPYYILKLTPSLENSTFCCYLYEFIPHIVNGLLTGGLLVWLLRDPIIPENELESEVL